MRLYGNYLFGDLLIHADAFGTDDIFSYWQYRMNPYVYKGSDRKAGLVIGNKDGYDIGAGWQRIGTVGSGVFRFAVSAGQNGEMLWQYGWLEKNDIISSFMVSAAYDEICLCEDTSNTAGYLPFICLGNIMPYVMLRHNCLTFHSVLLESENRGIVLCAPSGTGKTTHARLWRDYKNALILNGDRTTCRFENGKWIGFSLPWSGTSGEIINRSVTLSAVVILEQGEVNRAERLYGLDAFGPLMQNLRIPVWDRDLSEKAFSLLDNIMTDVPVYRLICRPDPEAAEVLDQALKGNNDDG